jgi:hypothetical protein
MWIVEGGCALVGICLAVPLAFGMHDRAMDSMFHGARLLCDPEGAGFLTLINGPAALLGFLAARLTGHDKPPNGRTAVVAISTALVIAVAIDWSLIWYANEVIWS